MKPYLKKQESSSGLPSLAQHDPKLRKSNSLAYTDKNRKIEAVKNKKNDIDIKYQQLFAKVTPKIPNDQTSGRQFNSKLKKYPSFQQTTCLGRGLSKDQNRMRRQKTQRKLAPIAQQ